MFATYVVNFKVFETRKKYWREKSKLFFVC